MPSGMEQRLSFVTLVVADVAASRGFYVDGLGWTPEFEQADEVVMIRVGEKVMLSLWDEAHFIAEVGERPARDGVPPITLAHNLPTPAEVDAVLAHARAAGAEKVSAAEQREWGGYTGYFADPDGYRWEIAYNPTSLGETVLP